MKYIILIFSISILIITSGCGNVAEISGINTNNNLSNNTINKQNQSSNNEISGTVNYYELEGGFWGLTSPDGNKYLLIDNNTSFVENSNYTIYGEAHPERISFQMWGTPFEVTSITSSSK